MNKVEIYPSIWFVLVFVTMTLSCMILNSQLNKVNQNLEVLIQMYQSIQIGE